MLRRTLCCVALVALACARPQREMTTTIIIVRHAEKQSAGTDPDLNDAGIARAKALAAALANARVSAVYVTQYKRTRETAQPLIDACHCPLLQVGIDLGHPGDYPQRVAGAIRARDAGKVVVVVTHSNALPALLHALSGVTVAAPRNDQYDGLYVVTQRGGAASVVVAQYGD